MAKNEYENENSHEDSYLAHLPKETCFGDWYLYQWRGFWFTSPILKSLMASSQTQTQTNFKLLPDDIILASLPKSGTTWLKALIFSIIHQKLADEDPLLTHNPHQLIPFLEFETLQRGAPPDLTGIPSPRVFASHLPYELLSESIKSSGCRIIYVARNPRDNFVSWWHFTNTLRGEPFPLKDSFESFCKGVIPWGPFFEHVLGYWKMREKVHFVKYEELKEDPKTQVKKLAKFLGYPLDSEGEVEEIVWRCSHDRLSNLEINKKPELVLYGFQSGSYFRRGVVGDWQNHLTDEMIERLDGIACEKFEGSGLYFQVSVKNVGGD